LQRRWEVRSYHWRHGREERALMVHVRDMTRIIHVAMRASQLSKPLHKSAWPFCIFFISACDTLVLGCHMPTTLVLYHHWTVWVMWGGGPSYVVKSSHIVYYRGLLPPLFAVTSVA
jgi:hypothetical protein